MTLCIARSIRSIYKQAIKKREQEDLKKHFFPIRVRLNLYILVPYDCEIDDYPQKLS